MTVRVKVCGLTEPARIAQAADLGAAFVGFVHYPPSPRYVDPARLRELMAAVPSGVESVGVVVDMSDAELDGLLQAAPLDALQLHGYETPERVRAIALRTGLKVFKALRVEEAADLAPLDEYADAADLVLLDAKPPRDASWPGGHGLPFDWRVLQGVTISGAWGLAGGLNADNLEAAIALTGAPMVDVSSGVETAPGIKDPEKLAAFFAAVRRLNAAPVAP